MARVALTLFLILLTTGAECGIDVARKGQVRTPPPIVRLNQTVFNPGDKAVFWIDSPVPVSPVIYDFQSRGWVKIFPNSFETFWMKSRGKIPSTNKYFMRIFPGRTPFPHRYKVIVDGRVHILPYRIRKSNLQDHAGRLR